MEENNKKEFYYILNLTKLRIFFISFSLVSFLSVVFVGGLFIGRFTKKIDKNNNIALHQNKNINLGEKVSLDLNTSPLRHKTVEYSINKEKTEKQKNIKQIKKIRKYYIQVFATSNQKKAKIIYKNLKIRKYPANVKVIKKSGKSIFVIRVGLYQNIQRANRHLKMIKTKFPKAILRTT